MILHSMLLMIFACCPLLGYAQQTAAVTEKEEANKAVVRYITARGVNTGNVDAWDEVLAPGYVRHSQATTGMEELR
ncbi:MAG TPA: hypothetical protein VKP65_01365, partial [Rhodothermales bacterium]|nr:hypothetical protein [Rhodothermales bacterium]